MRYGIFLLLIFLISACGEDRSLSDQVVEIFSQTDTSRQVSVPTTHRQYFWDTIRKGDFLIFRHKCSDTVVLDSPWIHPWRTFSIYDKTLQAEMMILLKDHWSQKYIIAVIKKNHSYYFFSDRKNASIILMDRENYELLKEEFASFRLTQRQNNAWIANNRKRLTMMLKYLI